jgi:fructan beta-fructosidase
MPNAMTTKTITLLLCFATSLSSRAQEKPAAAYEEKYRPWFHFSPERNWTNDPNGLVYLDSTYHLFYQFNPFGNQWGHMSWGHAVSSDLVHWKHLPVAIPEQKDYMIFSGSVVVDERNTTGFRKGDGPPPMVAVFTAHREGKNQSQYLAYSLDKGITWSIYDGNPVLDLHKKDFRDPNVTWYAPGAYWLMSVSQPIEKQISFYRSADLKDWKHLSDFGPAGDTTGIWECPDLIRVPVDGQPGSFKWVIMQSPAPYMQYFVGEFDGTHFRSENMPGTILRPDYGPDYYAAISYEHLPEGMAPVSIGWVNNWNYANAIPVTPWKGAMSIPRSLSVRKTPQGWRLIQQPVKAIAELEEEKQVDRKDLGTFPFSIPTAGKSWHLTVDWSMGDSDRAQVRLAKGHDHETVVGYDAVAKEVFIDRSKSGDFADPAFRKLSRYAVPVALKNGQIRLDLWFDHSILEVFVNDGEYVLTAQVFPGDKDEELRVGSQRSRSPVRYLGFAFMRSAWK